MEEKEIAEATKAFLKKEREQIKSSNAIFSRLGVFSMSLLEKQKGIPPLFLGRKIKKKYIELKLGVAIGRKINI